MGSQVAFPVPPTVYEASGGAKREKYSFSLSAEAINLEMYLCIVRLKCAVGIKYSPRKLVGS